MPSSVAVVAAIAASKTRPSNPTPRSSSTTVAASVRDCAGLAVSAMRITSPPMLLGRKLLKNVATRNDPVRVRDGTSTPCAVRSSPQRQELARIISR
jgi:hypothetical protein